MTGETAPSSPGPDPSTDAERFEQELAASRRIERRLPWKELLALSLVVALLVARSLWFT